MYIQVLNSTFKTVLQLLLKLQEEIKTNQLTEFVKVLVDTFNSNQRFFVYGTGRSLLVGKAFSMRLMHLGFKSFVIGEVATPAIGVNDIFLIISKTLSNGPLLVVTDMARRLGALVVIMTSAENDSILKKADKTILIPDLQCLNADIPDAFLPLGTLFELSTMLLLDCVVSELMYQLGITEKEMKNRHANIP